MKPSVRRTLSLSIALVAIFALQGTPADWPASPAAFPASSSIAGDPSQIGQWDPPVDIGMAGIHATLLPSGKVLFWERVLVDGLGAAGRLFDPNTLQSTDATVPFQVNPFCGAMTILPDGRVLASGGELSNEPGAETGNGQPHTVIYDWTTGTWSQGADMNFQRWYATSVLAADGFVYEFSGFNDHGVMTVETEKRDPVTETFTTLPASADDDSILTYPRMFLLPDGRMFMAGQSKVTRYFDPATNTWTNLGKFNFGTRAAGMSVLLPGLHKVLSAGGGFTKTAEVIDLFKRKPKWTYTGSLNELRDHGNLVLLPDGTAAAIGGGSDPGPGGPSLEAEIYDPATGTWSLMAAQQYERQYHSTALLLPDGRVISAGDEDTPGTTTVEIFSPPYLFHGARPVITQAPTTATYASTFKVQSPDAADITKVVLMHPGATTHGFDQVQRNVGLSFKLTLQGSLKVTAPMDGNTAPPGYYMLFLVNSAGVPSVAQFVQLG